MVVPLPPGKRRRYQFAQPGKVVNLGRLRDPACDQRSLEQLLNGLLAMKTHRIEVAGEPSPENLRGAKIDDHLCQPSRGLIIRMLRSLRRVVVVASAHAAKRTRP